MLDSIEGIKNGAKFYKADLHIHTPVSSDYKEKNTTAHQIVQSAIQKGLDLIAITDHNTVAMCYDVIKVAKKSKLVVLPGVEISAQGGKEGIHILALFDCETTKDRIVDMLSRIGITSEKRGKQEALAEISAMEVFNEIQKAGGIAIAAHADQTKGIINDLRGQQRLGIIQSKQLQGLEIVHPKTAQFFDGKDPNYKRRLPCIQSSDAHSLSEIGQRTARLKMDKPCLEGIRQALADQESRIRFDEKEKLRTYPYILGMVVKGGFLDGQIIHFNKNLNCLIGGRGTGKSTIIELIRFCLDALPTIETFRERRLEMINNVLSYGGEVTVFIQISDGEIFKVQRQIGSDPHVYSSENKEINIVPNSLFRIVGYGETEIEEISYDTSAQLALIDKFSEGLEELKKMESDLRKDLQRNSEAITSYKEKISDIERKLTDLPSIREKLSILNKHNFDTKLEKQRKRMEEKSLMRKIVGTCQFLSEETETSAILSEMEQLLKELPDPKTLEEMPNKKILEKAVSQIRSLHSCLSLQFESERKNILTTSDKIEALSKQLESKHETQEKSTLELLKKLEAEGESEAAQIYLQLQQTKRELEELRPQESTLRRKLAGLEKKRSGFLMRLKQTRDKIFEKRQQCTKTLSEKLMPRIKIEVEKGKDVTEYYNKLKQALTGSRVYSADIEKIVNAINPFSLFEIVKEKRKEEFTKIGLTEHWAEVIVNYEPLREKLYEVQHAPLSDLPRISLEVGGKDKPLNGISLGQKCTTLLSLIMLETELPLIVDTPEEGLDNIFVFDSIVKNLREIKERRQLILATHNANIPVSGDSELIICLESDGTKGWISCKGSIDEKEIKEKVQQVLEGGKEAFIIRKTKYGY